MGARFAPSVGVLIMALWEDETIFNNRPIQLKCYQRYTDDLIIIWEGDMVNLQIFMSKAYLECRCSLHDFPRNF